MNFSSFSASLVVAMASSCFLATSFLYVCVLQIIAAHNSRLLHNGPTVESVRCPSNGVIQCGVDKPTETYLNVSLGQCNAGCNHIGDCSWFNFIDNNVEDGRGVCQLFDHQPQIGIKTRCTLYKVHRILQYASIYWRSELR